MVRPNSYDLKSQSKAVNTCSIRFLKVIGLIIIKGTNDFAQILSQNEISCVRIRAKCP